jgi:hypothetical protein
MASFDKAPDGIFILMTKDQQTTSPLMTLDKAMITSALVADQTQQQVMVFQLTGISIPNPLSEHPPHLAN